MNLLSRVLPKGLLDRRAITQFEMATSAIASACVADALELIAHEKRLTAEREQWIRIWLVATQRVLLIPAAGRDLLRRALPAMQGIKAVWHPFILKLLEAEAPLMAIVEAMVELAEARGAPAPDSKEVANGARTDG